MKDMKERQLGGKLAQHLGREAVTEGRRAVQCRGKAGLLGG